MQKQESWVFTDTKCKVDKNTAFKWNTLFQEFQTKKYQVLLQYDPSTKVIKGNYKNISKSRLHQEATKTLVLPYPDVIEWITWRIDHESRIILIFEDKHVANYQVPILNQLYHFKETQEKVSPEWLQSKTVSIDFLFIMKVWWSRGKFRSNPSLQNGEPQNLEREFR